MDPKGSTPAWRTPSAVGVGQVAVDERPLGEGAQGAPSGAVDPAWARGLVGTLRGDPERGVLMNAVRKHGIQAVALDRDVVIAQQHAFSLELDAGAVTNQRASGRCWLFAGLNTLRLRARERMGLKDFEFSQAFLMFWDKFERANHFLENILETLAEPLDGRLVSFLLAGPLGDGGQWDMFVSLVEKYGVVPKYAMPESFHSGSSAGMNRVLVAKLREDAARLRAARGGGQGRLEAARREKDDMLIEIYRMLAHFLGEPPVRFDLEYRDKDHAFHRAPALTPQDFYQQYVGADLAAYVSLIHAPTADKPLDRTYTVRFLGNVRGGRQVLYLNAELATLKQAALAQLEAGEPVWFGCDVGKMSDRESGVMDSGLFDYGAALGVPFHLDKAQRLDYGESRMTHAMVLTGAHVVDGRPQRWKVQNSWGKDPGRDGYYVMTDRWFDQYLYQVVVRREYLSPALQAALAEPPIVLDPWDPMGALARG